MLHDHPAAAAAAARLLGEIGKADELLSQGGDRRRWFAPCNRPTAGCGSRRWRRSCVCSRCGPSPVRATCRRPWGSSRPAAACACWWHAQAEEASAAWRGCFPRPVFRRIRSGAGRKCCFRPRDAPDYELALIDVAIDRPVIGILLQQLRHDPRTASLRVGLVARSGYFDRAERLARLYPPAKAFARPQDDKAFRWQLDQLNDLAPREFVDFPTRQRQAAEALDLLAELYRSSAGVYDLRGVQQSVIAALYNPKLAVKAAAVLAQVNSAESQRALVNAASRLTLPLGLRQAAVKAFRQNTEKHGILLTTDEISRQYRRYNREQESGRRHAARLGPDPRLPGSLRSSQETGGGRRRNDEV